MKIDCTDTKTFVLIDESKKLGYVTYDGLFSQKANALIGSESYTITPKGFFSTIIVVTKHDTEVARLTMNWKGHVMISLQDGQTFTQKTTGAFLSKYALEDAQHQQLFVLHPHFNWKKFSYNYTVSYDNAPTNILLILLATYAANYSIAAMSASM